MVENSGFIDAESVAPCSADVDCQSSDCQCASCKFGEWLKSHDYSNNREDSAVDAHTEIPTAHAGDTIPCDSSRAPRVADVSCRCHERDTIPVASGALTLEGHARVADVCEYWHMNFTGGNVDFDPGGVKEQCAISWLLKRLEQWYETPVPATFVKTSVDNSAFAQKRRCGAIRRYDEAYRELIRATLAERGIKT